MKSLPFNLVSIYKKNLLGYLLFFTSLFISLNISGQIIYTVDSPQEADLIVFVVDSEDKCDLKVFFVEEKHQLGKDGVWMGTFNVAEADKKVYFTFEEKEAQLKIFVVDKESDAGWRNEEKRKLMSTNKNK